LIAGVLVGLGGGVEKSGVEFCDGIAVFLVTLRAQRAGVPVLALKNK